MGRQSPFSPIRRRFRVPDRGSLRDFGDLEMGGRKRKADEVGDWLFRLEDPIGEKLSATI